MDSTKLMEKIKKLQAMSKMVGNEAENAKRIINKLIEKYQLNPDTVLDERKRRVFKVHRLKKYAIRLSYFIKVPVYSIRNDPDYITIEADSDEYKMFYELLGEIKWQFNKQERIFKTLYSGNLSLKNAALKSFMLGYMESNFPSNSNLCTFCGEGRIVNNQCTHCGMKYKSSKYRGFSLLNNAYDTGRSTTTKSLRHNKQEIGYHG